jgi:hypothetical protein
MYSNLAITGQVAQSLGGKINLSILGKPYWYAYAGLSKIITWLNLPSHKPHNLPAKVKSS